MHPRKTVMKKLITATVLATSGLLAVVTSSVVNAETSNQQSTQQSMQQQAQSQSIRGNFMFNRIMKKMADELELTDSQQAQIVEVMQQNFVQFQDNREQWQSENEQMQTQIQQLINSDNADPNLLNELAEKRADQAKARFIKRIEVQRSISQILTAEQREKLSEKFQAMRENRQGFRGGFGGGFGKGGFGGGFAGGFGGGMPMFN